MPHDRKYFSGFCWGRLIAAWFGAVGMGLTLFGLGASTAQATNILVNPGFESGFSGWSAYSETSDVNLMIQQSSSSHGGAYRSYLCGYNSCTESLVQVVTIPSDATTTTLQFWYLISGTETSSSISYDTLAVNIDTPAGTTILKDFGTLSNLNDTGGNWVQSAPLDVSEYAGQTIMVAFIGRTDGSNPTHFFIDDVSLTTSTASTSTTVIEFYNTNLDNFFITANAGEAAAIDSGSAGPGWYRTGFTFKSGGSSSVCRFYGSQYPGPNSHFYTADAGECDYLIQLQSVTPSTEKRWNFESLDFQTTPAPNGACPAGTTPVYRAYNNGSNRGVDSNHRITTSMTAITQVVNDGWIFEGVVMCAPI